VKQILESNVLGGELDAKHTQWRSKLVKKRAARAAMGSVWENRTVTKPKCSTSIVCTTKDEHGNSNIRRGGGLQKVGGKVLPGGGLANVGKGILEEKKWGLKRKKNQNSQAKSQRPLGIKAQRKREPEERK